MLLQPLPGETAPFRSRVADFYRGKGYQVRENARVRGASENVYAVDMVATGPLGALLVSFGDAAGVDGPELGRVRKLARDIGATPVIAAPELQPELRRMAAQFGVVVVDDVALVEPNPIPNVGGPTLGADSAARDLEAHPWPASGRARPDVDPPVPEPVAEPVSLWRNPAPAPAAAAPRFSWLQPAAPEVEPVADAAPTPLTSAVLGRAPVPIEGALDEAAVEHEAVLVARRPTLGERVEEFARDNADTRSLLKFSIGALVGAGLLFLAIRLLA
ncbi:MAG: hypothetical protein QOD77_1692 [Thermoplasmata archaeon]|jgi:hypothetical protein|nr:hypothetical protein [Thermoplasmata archaeon]